MVLPQQTADFLTSAAPFDQLENDALLEISRKANLMYLTGDNQKVLLEQNHGRLFLIQSGQFSVRDAEGPVRHLSEGDYFGHAGLLDKVSYPLELTVDKPGLVYSFTPQAFEFAMSHPGIADFFHAMRSDVLQNHAVAESQSMWLYKGLGEVLKGSPISMDVTESIQNAAIEMTRNKVSSLLITEQGRLAGIITDRDLRSRVVAKGLDIHQSVQTIMTDKPAMVTQNRTLFDAICIMNEHNVHHLPVIDRHTRQPIGMLTTSDVVRLQRGNVLFIIGELAKAENLYSLSRVSWQLPHYFASHARRPVDFDIAGKVLSQATDMMTRKLINYFQRENGPAPMPYSWIVYGSQAREDQTMGSDQDNGLLLARTPTKGEGEYFRAMSEYVCDGLAKCGIKLCDGNIMASNPELRLSLDQAVEQARAWVLQPTPEAIMHFNIFLDARCAAGDGDLFRKLQQARVPLLKQSLFLAALSRHANQVSVPLSMFQKFVYEKRQEKANCIDLKVRAVALINNLVRLYALASGLTAPATLARLASLPAGSGLAVKDAENLRDIWLFLNRLRWRHQLTTQSTDNLVSVDELSSIEKHQLKAAFKAIDRAQQAAVMKFSGGMG
ncbi:CBS domain-containing protein [Alteromonas aestuariivivens]|uniref:CBS domain-containing protein n=1 Tax=Alteromonas aestuariivivens TaxID=1938339 RepID=A0A3D8M305_9ALTE|nr:DUF294 nucleotidyltransferase-like domain-containing protein [Alteromonas aestuariivivens]RDV24069.1 CBS domain-containing protein [Alteromonas aestuariivivens]